MNHLDKPWEYGPLSVSGNKRYLQNGDKPFFWLGDTAWLLFQNLSLEESYIYLKNRKDKGYNVIQATLVHTLPQTDLNSNSLPVNRNNINCAVKNNDFGAPDLDGGFWQQVDKVVDIAQELGLYMALLPAWGAMVKQGHLNINNAEAYGRFLAERYGQRKNIIWLIGGDVRGSDGYDVFMLLGSTIKKIAPQQMMGFHPFGRTSSSLWFDDAKWLDFNMFQSGHRRYDQSSLGEWDDNSEKEGWFGEDNWKYVERDYKAPTKRPTLDGEPSYEQIPQGLHDPKEPYWQDHDVRRYAWWSVLEGACGHTYGHSAIMQFYIKEHGKGGYGVKSCWQEAMHDPGAGQMGHMANFMGKLDFTNGAAAQQLVTSDKKEKHERVSAFAGENFAVFYSYTGQKFAADMSKNGWKCMSAWWFDPAGGVYSYFGNVSAENREFTPPTKPQGQNDWVLLLKECEGVN